MSGIYGYYCKDRNHNRISFDKALTSWNANYGKRVLSQTFDGARLSVNLEHFSSSVKDQGSFLENETYAAVIDALIFNREEFEEATDLSDEEFIFKHICKNGFASIKEINGDFAGVFLKKGSGEFILFTDHLGVRPLFYYIDQDKFVFSTDMRSFLAIPELSISINERFFFEKTTSTLLCGPDDFDFNEIHVVPKGCWCVINEDFSIESHAYWEIGQHKIRMENEKAYQEELYRLVSDAVTRRANAVDGILGSELSGGLDSSVISILLHRTGRDCRFFSWSRPAEQVPIIHDNDERNIINAICRQEDFQVQYFGGKRGKSITEILKEMNPPYGNTTTIRSGCQWFAGEGVKAVFTGHGGDEGVSHRCNLYELWYHKEYIPYVKAIYQTKKGKSLRLLRTISTTFKTVSHSKAQLSEIRGQDGVFKKVLNQDYLKRMEEIPSKPFSFNYDVVAYINQYYVNNRTMNTAYQASETGIRYLFPYLDYRVIDYAVSIPRWLYNNGIQKRRIYIETFRKIVPEELIRYFAKATVSNAGINNDFNIKPWIEIMKELCRVLNENVWKSYLNMDAINKIELSDSCSEKEYDEFFITFYNLVYCAQLQFTWEHAGDIHE